MDSPESRQGVIVLAATPIGNDLDGSARLSDLLGSADVVAAEDTRRVRAMARRLGASIGGRIYSLFEANEQDRVEGLVGLARDGATILVVADAGMPTMSDPGFQLVRAAVAAGVRVTCAPGPSAALAALAVSALPTDRFVFEGFVPRRAADRASRLAALADERRTLVFFESPRRLAATLGQMAGAWGAARPACVARELTKVHEEVVRGGLGELAAWASSREILGEVTIVIGGAEPPARNDVDADLVAEVLDRVDAGARLSEAAADIARISGTSRRVLYQAALIARGTNG